ncbi:MAG TPA: glycosyltransferase [Candidatus Thermoplasmatota archaeon]|nr:glycosyltransferase [Candidatus Thermoplasmatota archaeon]
MSVVVTVRNEERNLPHLLESLLPQRHLAQVVLVDAISTDRTVAVAQRYENDLPITIVRQACLRGEGRNVGARHATGELLAFIDGDCMAGSRWTESLVRAWGGDPRRVVAGRTVLTGFWAFTKLHRVELARHGIDTSWPSCNLAYPRELFERVGGFDASFITAEDIDLNVRAVDAGAHIVHAPDALVYARARDSITGFVKQAYWNGYGRKQLTRKHGRLWADYSFRDMVRHQGGSFWGLLRMGAGAVGYLTAKRRGPGPQP